MRPAIPNHEKNQVACRFKVEGGAEIKEGLWFEF